MQLSLMCIFQWYQYPQPDTNIAYTLMTYIYKMLGIPNYNVLYNNEATHLISKHSLTCPTIHHLQYHLLLSSCSLS